jgi:hypothetical protein
VTDVSKLMIPQSPRAGLVYVAEDGQQEAAIRYLMLIIGAGRYFCVDEFDADWRDRYNIYLIGGPVANGAVDARVQQFVRSNRDWLTKKRVVLFGFRRHGESVEAALEPLHEALGDAVLDRIGVAMPPVGLNLPEIARIGLRMKRAKEGGARMLSPQQVKSRVEDFLRSARHCVLCTGRDGEVRGTTVSYTYHDGHAYIMSEGSEKFANLLVNDRVSIALFVPRTPSRGEAGLQLSGKASIWHPDSEEYRRIIEIRGGNYENLRSLPFLLWALDVKLDTAELWASDLTDEGYSPKQTYSFTEG